jgi:hypothetical protein
MYFFLHPPAVISSAGINDPESDPRAMDGQYIHMETRGWQQRRTRIKREERQRAKTFG